MIVTGGTVLQGVLTVPGDKSISHRAVMLGSLAQGETKITGFLAGEDCLSTIDCFRQLGVDIKRSGDRVTVKGAGLYGLKKPEKALYVGNSGTTIRLMSGILAAQNFISVIDGDASIQTRPMQRVIQPLSSIGALIFSQPGGRAPLVFRPAEMLTGGVCELSVASAQVKSALLLAGLYSNSPVTVKEPSLSRDHTERMLKDFGIKLTYNDDGSITLPVRQKMTGCTVKVPGDISSAAFMLAAAAVCPNSRVTVRNVGLNPTRAGIIEVLQAMGADITIEKTGRGAEPVGDITIKYRPLKATRMIKGAMIPRLIDEIPVIAVLAATAEGRTVIKDAGELRIKESDRISLMVKALRAFGVAVEELEDGMEITGQKLPLRPVCGELDTAGDHRLAMSFAVAGLASAGRTSFGNDTCVAVSYPDFARQLKALGADIEEGAELC